jgi:hypothetical protein
MGMMVTNRQKENKSKDGRTNSRNGGIIKARLIQQGASTSQQAARGVGRW